MFTGIVETTGLIRHLTRQGDAMRMRIARCDMPLDDVRLGDSIAVSGPCLTVVALAADTFDVDVSIETLARTTLGERRAGDAVNLEKALRLSDRLGGHLVSGHVDGVGVVAERQTLRDYVRFALDAPAELARYIAMKGSITVDGVSLTVNAVTGRRFDILTIPHTLSRTTLGALASGARVNLEVDVLARYLERLLEHPGQEPDLTLATLAAAGFAATRSP